MTSNLAAKLTEFYQYGILDYVQEFYDNPVKLLILLLDIIIVIFLAVKLAQTVKGSRAGQLLKGIILFIAATAISGILGLKILNFILTSILDIGVIALLVIFQPELRRALEQLGTNKLTKFFGITEDIETKTRENIYKVVIAALELSKQKIGALIVVEREIQIKDIIDTGVAIDSEISPQILVNLFTPKTPLHDGAVIISNNKIAAAACMLPLASDKHIAKELGTRHRAAIGISAESDAVVVVVSEETGKISVAKDGTLIADLKEESLKKILIKHVVTKRFGENKTKVRHLQILKNKVK